MNYEYLKLPSGYNERIHQSVVFGDVSMFTRFKLFLEVFQWLDDSNFSLKIAHYYNP